MQAISHMWHLDGPPGGDTPALGAGGRKLEDEGEGGVNRLTAHCYPPNTPERFTCACVSCAQFCFSKIRLECTNTRIRPCRAVAN